MTNSPGQSLLTCGFQGAAVRVVVAGQTFVADFTGHVTLALDRNVLAQYEQGAVDVVPLVIEEYVANGVGAVIGAISVIKDTSRDSGPSRMTAIAPGAPFPAVQDLSINMNVSIPALLPNVTLRNNLPPNPGPPVLRNSNVTAFPPQNDIYQLVEPIELEDINNPGPVLATISNFPITVNPPTA